MKDEPANNYFSLDVSEFRLKELLYISGIHLKVKIISVLAAIFTIAITIKIYLVK